MSMLDSFLNKGFKGSKCKTLLKLTIPRIKLLRNRRELQIRQMRKDIAKLLETGQEATARIRVEHIIREENMMAAQEIIELFCELIAVRLPIIESQRECPLDLKEAIASVCFAAPRCADLPELLQVQMSFASKYGKEFVAAVTELMPNCGVNRQMIELLSVRAPSPEKKLKLLKEIAEEHGLDWNPAPSETELFKSHEDLLSGPTQFVSGSKVTLPKEKHEEILQSSSIQSADEHFDSEETFDQSEFPEVPKVLLRPAADLEVGPPQPSAPHPEPDDDTLQSDEKESSNFPVNPVETKQFLPFITPPSLTSASLPGRIERSQSSSPSKTNKFDANVDLNDVLAAAKAAAESAERAAAAARSAASLAEVRISELVKRENDKSLDNDIENPFHASEDNLSATIEKVQLDDRNASYDYDDDVRSRLENNQMPNGSKNPTYDGALKQEVPFHPPQRIPSMDDDSYFSYPNLFNPQGGNLSSNSPSQDDSNSRHGL